MDGLGPGCTGSPIPRVPVVVCSRRQLGLPRPHPAHHTVGVTSVVVHTVAQQLLLVQVAGTTVRAGEGGPVGDGAGAGRG